MGCGGNAVERRDWLILMANALMIGLRRTGAGLMIGTTTDAIHPHCAADAIPNNRREVVRISATGTC